MISHAGYKAEPFVERFFWPGTNDPTAALCVADSIDYLASIVRGGWPAIMKRNHQLCVEAINMICSMLEIPKPCPDSMIAGMATFPLPASTNSAPVDYKGFDLLQDQLFHRYNIEIPVWNWSAPPSQLIRIAVQLYNSMDQYRYFATALIELLKT